VEQDAAWPLREGMTVLLSQSEHAGATVWYDRERVRLTRFMPQLALPRAIGRAVFTHLWCSLVEGRPGGTSLHVKVSHVRRSD
jgi:hypothetical protein